MLAVFYKNLYISLPTHKLDVDLLNFSKVFFPGVSEGLFKGMQESYGNMVVEAVIEAV